METSRLKAMGDRIRSKRLVRRLTIEKLSEEIDVSPSFLGMVERGRTGISLEKLVALASILDVSLDWLVFGNEKIRRPLQGITHFARTLTTTEATQILKLLECCKEIISD
ncbi:MAG: helix-turn-helix domain-containing protein [Clostridiales bacterium]|jgi:transcriptional regulator with XRE-family HTH domain|nr:helix-turn-helix domain-containing protein [Clostridiales bacterium]